jgi:hypothetical protein
VKSLPRSQAVAVPFLLAALVGGCAKCNREPGSSRPSARAAAASRPKNAVVLATIYDGALQPGWQDWGWGAHDLTQGAASIDLSSYGGFILHHSAFPKDIEGLVFRMAAPGSFGNFLEIRVGEGEAFPSIAIGPERTRALENGWVEVYVPWRELNPSGVPVDRLTLHARAAVSQERVRFDKLVLTGADPNAAPPAPARAQSVTLKADCRAPGHAISPYIYGVAGGGEPWTLGPTARRWGGNRTTRYNWQLLATNTGKDWFFENVKEGDFREYLEQGRKRAVPTALTLPMIGWVAKDPTSSGFPVPKFGVQHATDRYRAEAGDGLDREGKPIRPGPPTQTSVPAEPAFIAKWVEAIRADDERHGGRSVLMYILDNEPHLWSANHRDVHPEGVSYDELLDRTVRYASAVRAADPGALIAGPAEWGWSGYFYSAKDLETGATLRPDRRAHGDEPLLPWYLARLREHEKAKGERLLDVLDVHFYPQAAGVYGDASDAATSARRIRSTRALWDPSYKDESWIDDTVRLIPRLKQWVAENYPGLRVSIGEYNFGGEQHMSGALALAEALGRFGTEGVDYAFYWTFPPANSPAQWAFRAYRDFDGKGGHFLEQSLATTMAPSVSLFGSRDGSGKHVVLIALNLDPDTPVETSVTLDGCAAVRTARRFRYVAGGTGLVADDAEPGRALNVRLAPYSIEVFDLELE